MTMSYSYAVAVLYALQDKDMKKIPDKVILCAIDTCLEADHRAIRKREWINAVRWLLKKAKEETI